MAAITWRDRSCKVDIKSPLLGILQNGGMALPQFFYYSTGLSKISSQSPPLSHHPDNEYMTECLYRWQSSKFIVWYFLLNGYNLTNQTQKYWHTFFGVILRDYCYSQQIIFIFNLIAYIIYIYISLIEVKGQQKGLILVFTPLTRSEILSQMLIRYIRYILEELKKYGMGTLVKKSSDKHFHLKCKRIHILMGRG